MKTEYYSELAAIFFLLLITYFFKFSEFFAFDFTLVGWGVVAFYIVIRIKLRVLAVSALIHGLLFLSYFIGNNFVVQIPELHYGIVIVTSLFLSSATYGLVSGDVRDLYKEFPYFFDNKIFLYVCCCLIAFWVFFIFKSSSIIGASVVGDFGGSNYLTTSDLLAMFSLAMIASSRIKMTESIALAVITVVALVVLGSRSSMALFLLCYLISVDRLSLVKRAVFVVTITGFIWFGLWFIESSDSALFFRFRTIYELGGDASLHGRAEFFQRYLVNIVDNPICLLVSCPVAVPGDYVHNIFSVHQYFGFFAMFFMVIILLCAGYKLIFSKRPKFIGLFCFVVIQTLFFRAWVSMVFPVLVALSIWIIFNFKRASKDNIVGGYGY